tara:strand:- start:38 stop:604 length:567 start_codon:yes stop_codon:yes gene_type:complete
MDYLSQYYKNLAEQLQEKVVILQKSINEAIRPTLIPLTTAYDDSNDTAPNIAARTDEEEKEQDLRVNSPDNFDGDYPSAEYAQMARSLAHYNDAHLRTGSKMFLDRQQALRDALSKPHRGRPLSTYGNHTPTHQKAVADFYQSYKTPQEVIDQGEGEKVLADISRGILRKHPHYGAFVDLHNARPRVD